MHKKLKFILSVTIILLYFTYLSSAQSIQSRELTNQGSNFETTCADNLCATTIYSYDKYFNRNNEWEEIDESWKSCEQGFCTNNYYFQATASSSGAVSIQRDNRQFTQQITSLANNNLTLQNPIIQNNLLTYENILPNTDLVYQYLPHKLKEEIIIRERLENLENDLELTFNISEMQEFNLEKPFICDSNRKCRPINYTLTNNQITIIAPINFLTNETTIYPVIIDPSFSISNSSIIWNGRVEYDFNVDGDPSYPRINNPSTLQLGATDVGVALGDIDWNLGNIPNLGTINNATLRLSIESSPSPNFLNITHMEKNSSQYIDNSTGNENFFADMNNGTSYSYIAFQSAVSNTSRDLTFNQQGLNSINTAFTTTKRFSTGLTTNWSNNIAISARDNINASRRPVLTIQHTKEDYTLEYDANGNMIVGFGKYMEYDGWNRLSKIRTSNATGTLVAEYFYDHEGKRILKKVYNVDAQGNNESTFYMNTRPADFIQVVNTNGTEINETYIYLQDKLIAKFDTNGRKFFYHPDHLGSTSLVTNESGDVVEDILYLPYGDILSGNELSRFTYTGQEKDQETDFMNYGDGERSYYPRFARFLQCDKVKQNVYDPQLLNCYSYVRNNPYKYTDPTGNYISPLDVLDYASLAQSIYMFRNDPNTKNAIFLAVDVAFAATPIIGGAGFAVKGADKAAEAILGKLSKNGDQGTGLLNDAVKNSDGSSGKTSSSGASNSGEDSYQIAKEGGRHAGTYKNYLERSDKELQKGIDSYQKQVDLHQNKINNPQDNAKDWNKMSQQERNGLINYWKKESNNYRQQRDILKGILSNRQQRSRG